MKFNCPSCSKDISITDKDIGNKIECPSCQQSIRIGEATRGSDSPSNPTSTASGKPTSPTPVRITPPKPISPPDTPPPVTPSNPTSTASGKPAAPPPVTTTTPIKPISPPSTISPVNKRLMLIFGKSGLFISLFGFITFIWYFFKWLSKDTIEPALFDFSSQSDLLLFMSINDYFTNCALGLIIACLGILITQINRVP